LILENALTVLETKRLHLSNLSYDDCEFIVELVNEPAFIRFIGDKKVQTRGDAHEYLRNGPIGSYEKNGFGMFIVRLASDREPIGICGLIQREQFDAPDLGFAFLRRFWAQGYAQESAAAVLDYANKSLRLKKVLAIADPCNDASVRLITKLGLSYERMVRMEGDSFDIQMYSKSYR